MSRSAGRAMLTFVFVCCCRNANFVHINRLLREQLDQATSANQQLQMELHRVTSLNKEFEEKEMEWRKEEQVILYLQMK